jgi:manganese-dependent inorganic pyrophosphatase
MDFKNFTIDGKKVGIGQITTFDIEEIEKEKQEYIDLINKTASINDYYIVGFFVTDIIKNGSYVYYNDEQKNIFELSFDIDNIEQGHYIDGCVSRKKQIIPSIMNILEKK